MNIANKSKQFVFLTIALLILSPIVYAILYHFIGTKKIYISHCYMQFLLQHTKGARLIIESGSNSKYALDSYTLEKEFNIQTINIADNAGYPLNKKLLRLEKYVTKEDIVVLPLEWQYYTRVDTPDVFTNNLLGELNYYYNYTSYKTEFQEILNTPLFHTVKNIRKKYKLLKNQHNYLKKHINKFENNERGTLDNKKKFTIKETCDQYILKEQITHGFILSQRFKENIEIIQRLKTKTKDIFFMWPTVVGDDCYTNANKIKLNKFILDIEKYLNKHNIKIVGNPYENQFKTKDILDTYYHINKNARKQRTENFIKTIRTNDNLNKLFSDKTNLSYKISLDNTKAHMLSLSAKSYSKK